VWLFAGKTYASADAELLWCAGAWALHLLAAAALGLLVAGPRRWLLVLCSLASLRCIVSNHRPNEPLSWFPAAEWPLLLALPLGGLLLATDPGVQAWFRWAGSTSLAFTGLHKLNTDWFDPAVTCHRLAERLHTWWGLPEALHQSVPPGAVVALELATPLVLWRWPRVGLLLAASLLGHFVGIGATALSFLLLVTATSFLPAEAFQRVGRPVHGGPALVAAAVAAWAWQGPWSGPQYAVTYGLFAWVVSWGLGELVAHGVGAAAPALPERRAVLGLALVAWLLNGLAPYSGLKFQYSFAMLSNLRVDDDRHNSLFVPAGLRWAADPYVHVDRASYRDAATGRPLSGGVVQPDLFTPHALQVQRDVARQVGEVLTFEGTWQGRRVTHDDLDTLPGAPLFRERLTRGRAQECVH